MREIIFKAKKKDNGEWVEGCLVIDQSRLDIFKYRIQPIESGVLYAAPINPDTLCQHTGLTDKNGKKIWENDIVDTFEESSKEFLRNVVKFEDGCFKVFKKHYLSMHMDSYEKTDLKVVSNIFDNPELLEVE
jgi:hypothetical protein